MTQTVDYFFGPYTTPQEQRLRYVARNGVQHASELFPGDPLPGQPTTLAIITDAALPIDRVAVYFTTDDSEPEGERGQSAHASVVYAERAPDDDRVVGETPSLSWRATLPGQPDGALVRYRIDAWTSERLDQHWRADVNDPFAAATPKGREFAYHVDRRHAPDWVRDAIVYQIFVDRFATAHDQPPMRQIGNLTEFYGGTIRGVTEKLDYLSELGVNCLWLSPIMESPTYHSYNPSSYHDVSQRLGTNDDLRELTAAAHARGMRVLLDFVANHTSNEHPEFVAVQRRHNPADSEWYAFGPSFNNGYLTFYDVPGMPVLKTDSAPVRAYLIDAARHWLTDFGADGVRLDNVSGPAHAFWTFFQEGIKKQSADALTLGEVSGGMGDIATYAGRIDAAMDFPLTKQIRRVFAQREASLNDLLSLIAPHEAELPALMARARLLDNHDMHRFLWLAENDTRRLKLALVFLMALPGFPIIYYGTEVGLSQRAGPPGQDAYSREPMPWGADQRKDVFEHVRWLIARRNERVSLRRGATARTPLAEGSGAAEQVGALTRWTDDEATLVVFNNGETPARFTIERAQLPFTWADAGGDDMTVTSWLLTPEGAQPVQTISPLGLSGELPPMSATMIFWQSRQTK